MGLLKRRDPFYTKVLILGFMASVLWILLVHTQPFSDFEYYHRLAASIANGGAWGDTYTTVGYPIFLSPFYWIFGASPWVAKALNLALSLLNNVLVLLILEKIPLTTSVRKWVFLLFVLFPMNVYYTSIVATEIFFTTLLLLSTLVYLLDIKYKYVLIGVLMGLGTMVKPFFLLFAFAIFLTDLVLHKKLWQSVKKSLTVFIIAWIVITPWLYRNYKLIGEFTYVSNNGGIVLYINNNSQNKTSGWMPAEDVENSMVNRPEYRAANATQKNKMLTDAAKQWIFTHPREFLNLGVKRLVRTYIQLGDISFSFNESGLPPLAKGALSFSSEFIRWPVFVIGILSIVFYTLIYLGLFPSWAARSGIKKGKGSLYLIITFYVFSGVYFMTEGQSRYAFPTILSLTLYAVMGLEIIRSSLINLNQK